MAPKSPLIKKPQNVPKNAAAEAASASIDYDQAQTEEIESLRAIYMEDFEEVEVKNAWSKTTDRSFKLKIRASSDREATVTLAVTFTASYPRSAPLLDIHGLAQFHERTQKRIETIVKLRPTQLLGSEMIFTIVGEIEEALEDAVLARQQGSLPSLQDERANAEETANALAKEAAEAEARRLRIAQEEEDRVLRQMVDEELKRSRKDKPVTVLLTEDKRPSTAIDATEVLSFDQPAQLQVGNDYEVFKEVAVTALLPVQDGERIYLGVPEIADKQRAPLVVLKRRKIKKDQIDIIALEKILDAARKLRHTSLLNLLTFRVDRIDDLASELILCRERAGRGTLSDFLALGSLHIGKTRQFIIELLEGLDYLHRHGMPHGYVNVHSIYITDHPSVSPKMGEFGYASKLKLQSGVLPPKWRSPDGDSTATLARKSDVWDLGVIMIQMIFGLAAPNESSSPLSMLDRSNISESLEDLLRRIFSPDQRKRPSAFDLMPAEFLRTDAPVWEDTVPSSLSQPRKSSSGLVSPLRHRSRHNSSNVMESMSRYLSDFTEIGRLGKGGFGEVVKARNKLDGGIYAVKKIRQAPQLLDHVLSEVILLNRLNHPYVVRYFSTWVENDANGSIEEEVISTTEETLSSEPYNGFEYQSTGGLDFVSSSGYPGFEFAEDDDEDDQSEDNEQDALNDIFDREEDGERENAKRPSTGGSVEMPNTPEVRLNKTRSNSKRGPSTLYIQMEFCERRTLRDLIRRGMMVDDSWRYMRQVTEGLAHIHSHGIIHRDLKPDNIFVDMAGNPKIGDFGLATTSHYNAAEKDVGSRGQASLDMTRSVGTALYVAPELHSVSGSAYNDKVDMYSLGIIFFEMNQPFSTAMERINELQRIRQKNHDLPLAFHAEGDKATQGKLIHNLISHKSSERKSSTELLRSDILPLQVEDETVRQALNGLADSRSPYHQKVMSALFAHDSINSQRVKALAWEAKASSIAEDPSRLRCKATAKVAMEYVFKKHGAEEVRRDIVFPRSDFYTSPNVVQLLDASGNLLQLPYDLTLPHARQMARQHTSLRCTYAFGRAYRDVFTGGPPRANEEADFDIANNLGDSDSALDDAEMLKVMDEVMLELAVHGVSAGISFQINHGALLDVVLDHCRVPVVQNHVVKETLSKLGFHQWDWPKIRSELRNLGLSDTTLDDLKAFDFRDSPDKALFKMQNLLATCSPRAKAKQIEAVQHLQQVLQYAEFFKVHHKLLLVPLSCYNAKFFESGLLFQCVLERKNSRIVIAAGGRYDSLIQAHCLAEARQTSQGAVGLCIGLDVIASQMLKALKASGKGSFAKGQESKSAVTNRCDVLVVASGTAALREASVKVLSSLWDSGIRAELASGDVSEQDYSFVVGMKHEASTNARVTNMDTGEEADVPITSLVSHLLQELRELSSFKARRPLLRSQSSHAENERKGNVHVLIARHGSKKSNKYHIVEAAQQRWSDKLEQLKGCPILAIETRDDVIELIQNTTLGDAESWRKAVQNVQLNERQYVQQVQDTLSTWRRRWEAGEGLREASVFNFRTGTCIYYDLGL